MQFCKPNGWLVSIFVIQRDRDMPMDWRRRETRPRKCSPCAPTGMTRHASIIRCRRILPWSSSMQGLSRFDDTHRRHISGKVTLCARPVAQDDRCTEMTGAQGRPTHRKPTPQGQLFFIAGNEDLPGNMISLCRQYIFSTPGQTIKVAVIA